MLGCTCWEKSSKFSGKLWKEIRRSLYEPISRDIVIEWIIKFQGFHPFNFDMNAIILLTLIFLVINSRTINLRLILSTYFWQLITWLKSKDLSDWGFWPLVIITLIYFDIFIRSRIIIIKVSIYHINHTINTSDYQSYHHLIAMNGSY
jgi:hypothetical protein